MFAGSKYLVRNLFDFENKFTAGDVQDRSKDGPFLLRGVRGPDRKPHAEERRRKGTYS